MNILEKITALKNKFIGVRGAEQDFAIVDGWMEEAKRLFLIKSLKDHDGVKYVLEAFRAEILKINSQLNNAYSKDLKDTERDRLLDKRDLAQKYVNLFDGSERDLNLLEERIDQEDI